MGSNLGTLDLKASTLSIWPLALLKNGTLSALPYDWNSECLIFYKSQTSKLTANWYRFAVSLLFWDKILNIQNLNNIVLQSVCYFGTVNILNIQNLNDIILQSVCYFGTCKIYTFRIWVIRQCWKCSIFQESQWSNG